MNRWLVALLLFLVTVDISECNCYDNWSRCTPATSFATGIMWKDCPEFCKKCKGQPTGKCTRVFNKHCSGAALGGVGEKSSNPLDIATASLDCKPPGDAVISQKAATNIHGYHYYVSRF
ncbi:hypothetical protein OSTOST_24411, partial [Ostertagia ostertagi]